MIDRQENKHITLRLDAGGSIGLGHFYRSISLANYLLKKGWQIDILHKSSVFWNTVKLHNIRHLTLPTVDEEEFVINFCKKNNSTYFYVDGNIDFDEKLIQSLKENGTKIVFYQNLTPSRYLADIYFLPSIHQDSSFFEKFNTENTRIYQGLEYFTFNEKLFHLEKKQKINFQEIKSVAITSGGSDPKNLLLKVYNLLNFEKFASIDFHFYFGENFMHMSSIPKELKANTHFLKYNLEKILANDLVISAFGVSSYEMMSLGMPVIGIGHQESNAFSLNFLAKKTNSIINFGLLDDLTEEQLNSKFLRVVSGPNLLAEIVNNASKIIDKKGLERVSSILMNCSDSGK